MRRVLIGGLAGLAIVGAGLGLALLVRGDDPPVDEAVVDEQPVRNTASVTSTDFVESTEVGGTLGFGPTEALPNQASGIVTWAPEPGSVIDFGEVLYEVDGRPVLLFEGVEPMYRSYESRMSDGADVQRLEQLLLDLGFFEGTVDEDFTSLTEAAIEDWETELGVEATGEVRLGSIVFRPEPVRIAAVSVPVGAHVSGASVVTISSTDRVVSVDLDTSLAGILAEGDRVDVELPDESVVTGVVSSRSGVAVTEGSGPNATSYLPIEIVLDGSGTNFDESPVTVVVEEILEADAVAVPIASLLALAEGGYAVEVVVDDRPVLIPVELGTFLVNEVSVVGAIAPGDLVVVP